MMTVCDKSGLRPGVGAVGLLQRTEASRAVTVLPADLGDRPAGLVDHAQSLEACQSCVKLEDSGLAHRSCRPEEHVAAADGRAGPGAHSAGQGHGEGRAALALAAPDSVLKCRGPAPSLGSPGTPSSALPSSAGNTLPAQSAVVLPVPPGEASPKAQNTSAGFVTEPTACPSRRSSCGADSQAQVLASKQQQQKKKRKKKRLPLPGALSCYMEPAHRMPLTGVGGCVCLWDGAAQRRGEGCGGDVLTSQVKEEGGKLSHLGVYNRGTCLCLVHVSKANLRVFCLSFSQFIR